MFGLGAVGLAVVQAAKIAGVEPPPATTLITTSRPSPHPPANGHLQPTVDQLLPLMLPPVALRAATTEPPADFFLQLQLSPLQCPITVDRPQAPTSRRELERKRFEKEIFRKAQAPTNPSSTGDMTPLSHELPVHARSFSRWGTLSMRILTDECGDCCRRCCHVRQQ